MGEKKQYIRGRVVFHRYKRIILFVTKMYKAFPLNFRKRLLEKHRNTRGKLGYAIRYCLIKSIAKNCGDNVSIAPGAYIYNAQNLYIGNNVSIHPMCYIECGQFEDSYVRIDDDVSIAHGSTLICTSHTYRSPNTDIIKDMPVMYKPVHICSNVWIAAKCSILCGVTVESGCVIGAGSVVTKSTEANGIYVGSPARRLKDR